MLQELIKKSLYKPHKANESELTSHLLRELQEGGVHKLISDKPSQAIQFYREVGNSSYITDICISTSCGGAKKTMEFNNNEVGFVAIEVKISNWKDGLYQAWRYSNFAERSFLALYRPYIKRVNLRDFETNNIGLIAFDEKNIDVILYPRINRFHQNTYEESIRKQMWEKILNTQGVLPTYQKIT